MIIVCLCETSISSIAKIYLKMRSQISSMSCSKILLVASTCTFPFWMFISHEYLQLDVGHFKGFMLIPKLDDLIQGWNFKYCPTSFLDSCVTWHFKVGSANELQLIFYSISHGNLQNLTTKALCKHFVFPFPQQIQISQLSQSNSTPHLLLPSFWNDKVYTIQYKLIFLN